MAIGPEALIPLGAIAIAALLSKKKKKTTKKSSPKAASCPPFPALDEELIASTAQSVLDSGAQGLRRVSAQVGRSLYPKDPSGGAIQWPTTSPWELPPSTDESVVCVYAEIIRVVADMGVQPDEEDETPGEMLTGLLSDRPQFGKFYLIKNGDKALGESGMLQDAITDAAPLRGTGSNRLALLKLMSTPNNYNADLYGRTKFTDQWPAYTGNDGINLGAAFLPRHKNAIQAIASGQMPERNISASGSKQGSGSSYALLWIPPIDVQALKDLDTITISGETWSDGSSVLNPPPELLELLEGA